MKGVFVLSLLLKLHGLFKNYEMYNLLSFLKLKTKTMNRLIR